MVCPECNGKLNGSGNNYSCGQCGTSWNVTFTCEVCRSEPTIHSSSGSVSFFCETCKSLKSRESMKKEFSKKG